MKEVIVIKLGGSTISPSKDQLFNLDYCKKFAQFIQSNSDKFHFLIVTGGGALAKQYQSLFEDNNSKDLAGIVANDTNGKLLSLLIPNSKFDSCSAMEDLNEKYNPVIFGGSEPGHTGDFVATELAKEFDASKIILLKDVKAVYKEDPKLNPESEIIKKMTWDEYRNLFGDFEYKPKISVPVDPVAAKLAQENNLKILIVKSDNFDNLQGIMNGKNFEGTVIE